MEEDMLGPAVNEHCTLVWFYGYSPRIDTIVRSVAMAIMSVRFESYSSCNSSSYGETNLNETFQIYLAVTILAIYLKVLL